MIFTLNLMESFKLNPRYKKKIDVGADNFE